MLPLPDATQIRKNSFDHFFLISFSHLSKAFSESIYHTSNVPGRTLPPNHYAFVKIKEKTKEKWRTCFIYFLIQFLNLILLLSTNPFFSFSPSLFCFAHKFKMFTYLEIVVGESSYFLHFAGYHTRKTISSSPPLALPEVKNSLLLSYISNC